MISNVIRYAPGSVVSYCDEEADTPSLIKEADEKIEDEKVKISAPFQYENLKGVMGQGSVNTFDGFRMTVQKPVNLNTLVVHT